MENVDKAKKIVNFIQLYLNDAIKKHHDAVASVGGAAGALSARKQQVEEDAERYAFSGCYEEEKRLERAKEALARAEQNRKEWQETFDYAVDVFITRKGQL